MVRHMTIECDLERLDDDEILFSFRPLTTIAEIPLEVTISKGDPQYYYFNELLRLMQDDERRDSPQG